MSEFKFYERPDPPVCTTCGKAACINLITEDGKRSFDYCQICEKETTIRKMTEEEIQESKREALLHYEMAVASVKNKLNIS